MYHILHINPANVQDMMHNPPTVVAQVRVPPRDPGPACATVPLSAPVTALKPNATLPASRILV